MGWFPPPHHMTSCNAVFTLHAFCMCTTNKYPLIVSCLIPFMASRSERYLGSRRLYSVPTRFFDCTSCTACLCLVFTLPIGQRGGAVAVDGEGGHESTEVTNKVTFEHKTTFKDNSFDVRIFLFASAQLEGGGCTPCLCPVLKRRQGTSSFWQVRRRNSHFTL